MAKKIPVWDKFHKEIIQWIEVERYELGDILYKILEECFDGILDIRKEEETFHILIKVGTKVMSEYFLFFDKDEIVIEKHQ